MNFEKNKYTVLKQVISKDDEGNTVTAKDRKLAKTISCNGMFYRDDIAYRAIAREQNS